MKFVITQIIALRIIVRISNVPFAIDKVILKSTVVHTLSALTKMGRATNKRFVRKRGMLKPTKQVLQTMVSAFLCQGLSANKCWGF